MIKIVYIISDTKKSLQFEWIALGLKEAGIEQFYILINPADSSLETFLKETEIPFKRIPVNSKTNYLKSFFRIVSVLREEKPNIVHYHLMKASVLGAVCSYLLRIKKRISTRHHSDFHRVYAPRGKKWDKLVNRLSTDIIAISQNVKNELILHENVPEEKVTVIHHGLDFAYIQSEMSSKTSVLMKKYNLTNRYPIVGAISRYEYLKGIDYLIEAFKIFLKKHPNARLVLANAKGSMKNEIQELLRTNFEPEQYLEIDFEEEIFALYNCFDAFVHVPVNLESEAFGQTYIEPLAVGTPCIFTVSGIVPEFKYKNCALFVPYKDACSIAEALEGIINMKEKTDWTQTGQKMVQQQFDIKKTLNKQIELYLK